MRLPELRLPKDVLRSLPRSVIAALAFAAATLLAVAVAWGAALVIEARSASAVKSRLLEEGITWAEVEPDGLQVRLRGTAPNEAARFRAVNLAGSVIDPSGVRDSLDVAPAQKIEAPRFSLEMLRNDDGIQLIGLLPDDEAEAALGTMAESLSPDIPVADMLETAAYPAPDGWAEALEFGMGAMKLLPRSKISVAADRVEITAIATSEAEKRNLAAELNRTRPEGLAVTIDISAPRPVLTPFTLRFVVDAEGARFDACSADTDQSRDRILAAAAAAGVEGKATCTVGLGVPTPKWADAAAAGIKAVADLGAGTITFSDADVSLLASEDTPQATFDRVVGDLEAALPDVFSLDATLPKKADAAPAGPAEFTATKVTEGKVELRGRLTDQMQRDAVDSFAKAQFGIGNVLTATRLDPDLPDGWPVRVLAGLEALAQLDNGTLLVRADTVEVAGVTGSQTAKGRISQVLSDKLGQGKTFKVSVRYDEALDPLASIPTPEECAASVDDLLSKRKITFTPGSAEIDGAAAGLMTALADVLTECPPLEMEIAGHTDAQGSEDGNRALSQARAEAVLVALQGRRVDVSGMTAVGYGEAAPIADNDTEAGREANRRIEFSLKGAPPLVPTPSAEAAAAVETDDTSPLPGSTRATGVVLAAPAMPATAPEATACLADVQALLAKSKITFAPGSADIDGTAAGLMTAIATVLKRCEGLPVEVAGHTDSQGSERGNLTLSQGRAEAVLAALKARGVDVTRMRAAGYGETKPVAENDTDDGRETNRRIEFTLIGTQPDAAPAANDATASPQPTGTPPDFSSDDSPSVAPAEKTLRPASRPANNG
jgi:OOP family OmpA-OmpF porin